MTTFYCLLYLAVNCSTLFVPEEYLVGFFLEITSGMFPYATLLGSTVVTCYASVYKAFWKNFSHFLPDKVDSDLEVDSRLSELLVFSAMLGSTVAFGALRCRVVVTVSLLMVFTILHGTA